MVIVPFQCNFFMFQDITFGFVFRDGDKAKLFSLFLAAVSTHDTERPEVAFRKFFSGLNKQIFETGSSKKMRSFLVKKGGGSTELGSYWKAQNNLVLKGNKFDWNRLQHYSAYLQPFAKFTDKMPLSEKEFKQFIRGII